MIKQINKWHLPKIRNKQTLKQTTTKMEFEADTKSNTTAFLSMIKLSKHTSIYSYITICIDWTNETLTCAFNHTVALQGKRYLTSGNQWVGHDIFTPVTPGISCSRTCQNLHQEIFLGRTEVVWFIQWMRCSSEIYDTNFTSAEIWNSLYIS